MKRLACSILFVFALAYAAAAQTVTITASNIRVGGVKLSSGKLCILPVDASNHPLQQSALGGTNPGALLGSESCANVTNGVVDAGFLAPDTALSTPTNMCVRFTVKDSTGVPKYIAPCVQPASSGQSWCSTSGGVTACNFDNYKPNLAAVVPTVPGPAGPAGPTGATGPAGSASSSSKLQNVVQASNWATVAAAITANSSATEIHLDTLNHAAYTDTSITIPAGVALTAERGAYFSASAGASITWADPYTWTETGVIYPSFPIGDVRRYGIFPDGVTDYSNTGGMGTRVAALFVNAQNAPVPVRFVAGHYHTGFNCNAAQCSGARFYSEPGAIFDSIIHVIPSTGTINLCTVAGMTRSSNVVTATFTGTCSLVNGQQIYVMKTPDRSFDGGPYTLTSVTGSGSAITGATWSQTGSNQATSQIYGLVVDPPVQNLRWYGEINTLDRFGLIDCWNCYFQNIHVANDPAHHYGGGKARGAHIEAGAHDVVIDNLEIDDAGNDADGSANTDAALALDGDDEDLVIGRAVVHSSDVHGATLAGAGYHFGELRIERACTAGWSNNSATLVLNPMWAWNSSTTYHAATHDLVVNGGSYYYAIADSTNQAPPNATYWATVTGTGAVNSNVMTASECKYFWAERTWASSIGKLWLGQNYVSGDPVKYAAMFDETGYGNNANANRLFKVDSAIIENVVGNGVSFGDRNKQPANYNYQIDRLQVAAATGTTLTSGFGLVNVNTPQTASPSTSINAHVSLGTLDLEPGSGNRGLVQQTGTNLNAGYIFNSFGADTTNGPTLDLEGMFTLDRIELASLVQSASSTPMVLVSGNAAGSIIGSLYVSYSNSGGNAKPGLKITGSPGLTVGKYSASNISGNSLTAGSLWIDNSSNVELAKVTVNGGTNTIGTCLMFTSAITNVNILAGALSNCRWGVLGNSATFTNSNVYNFTISGSGTGGNSDIAANKGGLTLVSAPGFTAATHATNFPTGSLGVNDGALPSISGTPTTGDCASFVNASTVGDSGAPCASASPAWNPWFGGSYPAIASPAAGGTYWLGRDPAYATPPQSSTPAAIWPAVAPKACTIRAVKYYEATAGSLDSSANNLTLTIYDVTTSTNFTDTQATVALNGSATPTVAPLTGLASDSVALGDQLEVRIAMPASWGAQPTNLHFGAQVFCY